MFATYDLYLENMQETNSFRKTILIKQVFLAVTALNILSGCSSVLNTAGSGEYACPGMPSGVLCKTPAAVYKSTHLEIPDTDFDTPINQKGSVEKAAFAPEMNFAKSGVGPIGAISREIGPKPVREPAQVVRIWIAPWVDKQDNLHLAQIQYTEIKPRTWTVGKPESSGASSYTIPHLAFNAINPVKTQTLAMQPNAEKNERNEKRTSDATASATNSQIPNREANGVAETQN